MRKKTYTRRKNNRRSKKIYRGGVLNSPENPLDIYNLSEVANVKGSQTWLLYKDANNKDVIIKKLGPARWLKRDAIESEIVATTKAGDLGIGPPVVFSTIGKEGNYDYPVGYIVMKFIDGRSIQKDDLDDQSLVKEVNDLLKKMHDNGLRHDDLHNGNIMIGSIVSEHASDEPSSDDRGAAKPSDDDHGAAEPSSDRRAWIIDHSGQNKNLNKGPQTVENIDFESK
jgi:serine/threonine protein kinase